MGDRKMDYRILGSFEVWVDDRLVGLGGEKPRALLAILLPHHYDVVSADRLIDDLWGESPPESALRTLQAYVSRLRKALIDCRRAVRLAAPGRWKALLRGSAEHIDPVPGPSTPPALPPRRSQQTDDDQMADAGSARE